MIKLNPVLRRFAKRTPLPVTARAALERCLNPAQRDARFARVAEAQYTRTLFSTVFELMFRSCCASSPRSMRPIGRGWGSGRCR